MRYSTGVLAGNRSANLLRPHHAGVFFEGVRRSILRKTLRRLANESETIRLANFFWEFNDAFIDILEGLEDSTIPYDVSNLPVELSIVAQALPVLRIHSCANSQNSELPKSPVNGHSCANAAIVAPSSFRKLCQCCASIIAQMSTALSTHSCSSFAIVAQALSALNGQKALYLAIVAQMPSSLRNDSQL